MLGVGSLRYIMYVSQRCGRVAALGVGLTFLFLMPQVPFKRLKNHEDFLSALVSA